MKRYLIVLIVLSLWISTLGQQVVRRPIAVGCTGFPCNGVLDNFNRGDENPATGWTIAIATLANIKVESNLGAPAGAAYAAWSAGTFAADQEAYFEMSTAPAAATTVGVLLRFNNLNTSTETGYLVQQLGTVVRVYRIDTGITFTQLGADISKTPADGDSFGAKIVGSTITVQYCLSGAGCGVEGAGWTVLDTRTDATHGGSGYIGAHLDGALPRIDNFGGGAR